MNTDHLQSAIECSAAAQNDRNAQLLRLLDAMIDRVAQIEARLDRLSDLTVGDAHDSDFDERVIEALERRSMSACEVLGVLDDCELESRILSTIEENSGTVFSHIEAEIEEKNAGFLESYAFAEAVDEAVKGSIVNTVEEIIEQRISNDFLDADAEDVVRKGLRTIL